MMWGSEFYAKFELRNKAIADNWLTFHCDVTDRTKEEKKTKLKQKRVPKIQ